MARQKGALAALPAGGMTMSSPAAAALPSSVSSVEGGMTTSNPAAHNGSALGSAALLASTSGSGGEALIDVQYLPLGETDKTRLLTLQGLTVYTPDRYEGCEVLEWRLSGQHRVPQG